MRRCLKPNMLRENKYTYILVFVGWSSTLVPSSKVYVILIVSLPLIASKHRNCYMQCGICPRNEKKRIARKKGRESAPMIHLHDFSM